MSNCTDCGKAKPVDQQFAKAKEDAKKDAVLYQTPMGIYVDGSGLYAHISAFTPGYPFLDVVSQYT